MKPDFVIRPVEITDVEDILEVYSPYVVQTPVTFEYEVPSLEDLTDKVKSITARYPWLVCMQHETLVGYAYGSDFRYRAAYQWSPESTIYLTKAVHGRGIGSILYNALLAVLRLQGYYNVFAGVAIPNLGSEKLHTTLGFEEIGVFKKVGYKLGQWHDTRWFQLILSEHSLNPHAPYKITEIEKTNEYVEILNKANEKLRSISL